MKAILIFLFTMILFIGCETEQAKRNRLFTDRFESLKIGEKFDFNYHYKAALIKIHQATLSHTTYHYMWVYITVRNKDSVVVAYYRS